jgi:hypothetical protein
MDRRSFLRAGLGGVAALAAGPRLAAASTEALPPVRTAPLPYGALRPPDANGIRLPPGFRSRVVGRSRARVEGTAYPWHDYPDGGATFPTDDGGWVYVSNSEVRLQGGVGAIRFSADGEIVDAYRLLAGTTGNCAGGPTPWGTWLSAEEHPRGLVWECDPMGEREAVARPAMGTFVHEAVAVDPGRRRCYLTEDDGTGRLYRFTPARWPDLDEGALEAAVVDGDGHVSWAEVPDPSARRAATQAQAPASTPFAGGEGIWFDPVREVVFFATKGDDRVWAYDAADGSLVVLYDSRRDGGPLRGVDNVVVSPAGELLVAEDRGNMELVMVSPDGTMAPFLRVEGQAGSELAGPAFDPSGRRLYVSSQRGLGAGVTYEISGPFRPPATPAAGEAAGPERSFERGTAPTTTLRSAAGATGGDGGDGALDPAVAVGGFAALAVLAGVAAAWQARRRSS